MLNADQLKFIAHYASDATIDKHLQPLNDTMAKYEINTAIRMAHFLAQVLHESGSLRYHEEIASGSNYEGRKDLGNIQEGDGIKFKGRGLIQLTGRTNYEAYSKYLGIDLTETPELVSTIYSSDVAGWFWNKKDLNRFADLDDITTITKKINGGLNGFADRKQFLERAKKVLVTT